MKITRASFETGEAASQPPANPYREPSPPAAPKFPRILAEHPGNPDPPHRRVPVRIVEVARNEFVVEYYKEWKDSMGTPVRGWEPQSFLTDDEQKRVLQLALEHLSKEISRD